MSPEERVALEHRLTSLEVAVQELEAKIDRGSDTQDKLVVFMNKYNARWGLLIMLGTALWAAFVVFKDEIMKVFKG